MNVKSAFNISLYLLVGTTIISSCGRHDPSSPGLEYAPAMYHSRAYEPLTQITDESSDYYNSNPNNPNQTNMLMPVGNTVKLRKYNSLYYKSPERDLMMYHLKNDSSSANRANTMANPVPSSEAVLEEGKVLYGRYCQHCHGESGQGDGSVGQVMKGVPAYNGAVKDRTQGSIFYTITFGRNRMGSHASQIQVEDRWKIVHYVKSLQNQ